MEGNVYRLKMWVKAVEKTKSVDADDVIDALPGIEVANLTGGVARCFRTITLRSRFHREIKADGQFEVVSKTPETSLAVCSLIKLPDHDLVGDWVTQSARILINEQRIARETQVIETPVCHNREFRAAITP